MSISERILFFRKKRKLTQKQLGMMLGFSEKSAAIRQAQYENGSRTPKADLLSSLAEALHVSPEALDVPNISTPEGLMHTLFALEDLYGLHVDEINGEICLRINSSQNEAAVLLDQNLHEWYAEYLKKKAGEITWTEYDNWRYQYPTFCTNSTLPSPLLNSSSEVSPLGAAIKQNSRILYKLGPTTNFNTNNIIQQDTLSCISLSTPNFKRLLVSQLHDYLMSKGMFSLVPDTTENNMPDLLAFDAEGDLYLFDLKEPASEQNSSLHILDFGYSCSNLKYEDLNCIYQKQQKISSVDLLHHLNCFFSDLGFSTLTKEQCNTNQHFIIVTDGNDQNTLGSISYWKSAGLNISSLTYRLIEMSGNNYIEFDSLYLN